MFTKRQYVVYLARQQANTPVRAIVRTVHRDGTFTVEAQWSLNPVTGAGDPGYLGFKFRLDADRLTDLVDWNDDRKANPPAVTPRVDSGTLDQLDPVV